MLISYASYFAAYLTNNISKIYLEKIERIVLFGSVARNEATYKSDIDLFIELKKKDKQSEKAIKNVLEQFYKSREGLLFKAKGVNNKINIKLGKLKDWGNLYNTIASTGIVLYGPYEAKELPSNVKHYILVYWEEIGKNRGAFLNKVYGFKVGEKTYQGIISKFNGQKIGKSSIMLPVQYKTEFFKLLKHYKVKAKIMEVFV
ncbi:nucleotidyltransferase domain-containing protein [Candidatus Woesearchaeota archaeon]|nr:nucleotidyltransferase domain-containing protein [Candidatus Woesearchaeota archaeon]